MTTSISRPPSPPPAGTAGASVPTPKRASRAPLDPRLVREVRAARSHVARTTVLGLVQAGCVITTALVIGRLGASLLVDRELPQAAPALLGVLALALAIRALAVLVEQRTAHRAATDAIAQLRSRIVSHAAQLGPRGSAGRGADLTALATTGVENLRPYLVGYVPQLLLSLTVTPLCLLTIGLLDLTSALIALFTLPVKLTNSASGCCSPKTRKRRLRRCNLAVFSAWGLSEYWFVSQFQLEFCIGFCSSQILEL